jgi:pimeloyl-ACP methyl ester carboxylesterase
VLPILQVPSTDGVTLALIDLGGDGPPLLFCHPTGFHGMTWAPLAEHLAGVAHGWALDFRGHGDSTSPASMDFAWDGMADDVLAVIDHLGLADAAEGDGTGRVRAVGHSMGGAALLLAELRRPGTMAALWLFEPIVFPPFEGMAPGKHPIAAAARRRRPWFPDRDAAYANFATKPPLDTLDRAALRAYVDHGLRPRNPHDGDGDAGGNDAVELKCSPEVEAQVFENSLSANLFERLGDIHVPVTVAVSGDGGGPAQVGPLIADALAQGGLEHFPQLTHFGPMEDPAGMAAAIRKRLDLG